MAGMKLTNYVSIKKPETACCMGVKNLDLIIMHDQG